MSDLISSTVWQSALPSRLKPVAAALANEADDFGKSIHPSIAYIAWKTSKSERSVQENMAELRAMGALRAICHPSCHARDAAGVLLPPGSVHGVGVPVHYEMKPEWLPERPPWVVERAARGLPDQWNDSSAKGEESAPFPAGKDEELAPFPVRKGADLDKGVSQAAPDLDPDPEDPRSDPQINYPDKNKALYGLKPESLTDGQLAVFRHLHRSTSRLKGGGAPDAGWCEDLVRRGATLEDVEHAIDAASTKAAGLRYARATLERCVEQREANEDPHARPVVAFRGRREPKPMRPDTPADIAARAALVVNDFPEGMTLAELREATRQRIRAAREAAEVPS